MYYRLLVIKADDKAYIPHTESTVKDILEIVDYYKKNKELLPEALFYAGRTYDDLQDSPQALQFYYKAVNESNENTDKRLLGRLYAQIATIYLYQGLYEKALPIISKSLANFQLANDTLGLIFGNRDLGRAYTTLKNKRAAIYYYQYAFKLARKANISELESMVMRELGGYYMELGLYSKAYDCIQIGKKCVSREDIMPLYSILAQYYLHTNLDSASIYASRLLLGDNWDKKTAYQSLAVIAKQRNQYKLSTDYLLKYVLYADSTLEDDRLEACNKAASLYDYQLKAEENSQLHLKNQNLKNYIILLIITSLFLLILILAFRRIYIIKLRMEKMKKEKLIRLKEQQYKQSQEYINKSKEEIKKLQTTIDKLNNDKSELSILYKAQKETYEKNIEKILADKALQKQAISVLKKSDICKKFNTAFYVQQSDWNLLLLEIKKISPDFFDKIQALCLSDLEFKMSVLIKLGVPPSQISLDINRSRQWVTNTRKKLAQNFVMMKIPSLSIGITLLEICNRLLNTSFLFILDIGNILDLNLHSSCYTKKCSLFSHTKLCYLCPLGQQQYMTVNSS